jgi:MFS family permease
MGGLVSSFSMTLMSIADLLHASHRATAVGYLSACFSVGIIVGPLLGGFISTSVAGEQGLYSLSVLCACMRLASRSCA